MFRRTATRRLFIFRGESAESVANFRVKKPHHVAWLSRDTANMALFSHIFNTPFAILRTGSGVVPAKWCSLTMKYVVGDTVHIGRESEVEWTVVETKPFLVRLQEKGTNYQANWIDVSLVRGKK